MRMVRQCLAYALVFSLAVPAWSETDVVGSIVNGQSATLRDAPVTSGSTVFSGDEVSAGDDGRVQIAVAGGVQIDVLHGSTVRLTRKQAAVDLDLERGTASFTGEANGVLEAVLGDATIRPKGGPVFGILHMENPNSVVVIAQKGILEIATAHSTGTTTVSEGQAARITLVSDVAVARPAGAKPAQGARGSSPGNTSPSGVKLAMIALIIGGAATVAAVVLSVKEPGQSDQTLIDEVSPFTLQKK